MDESEFAHVPTWKQVAPMPIQAGRDAPGACRPPVVLRLVLTDAQLITGQVIRDRDDVAVAFCGWLDLMATITTLRDPTSAPGPTS